MEIASSGPISRHPQLYFAPDRKIGFAVRVSAPQDERQRRWTVGELLNWTTERLTQMGIPDARVDAEHLLAHALSCSRMDLYLRHAELLESGARTAFRDLVRRRLDREPVAYIEGLRGFHALGLDLAVDRRVLIPRPETEHLVDWVLEELPGASRLGGPAFEPEEDPKPRSADGVENDDEPVVVLDPMYAAERDLALPVALAEEASAEGSEARSANATAGAAEAEKGELPPCAVLDIGTGSGAIALALKHARRDARVAAVDVSEDALSVARDNAERCQLEVEFGRSDLLADAPRQVGGWSAITANLPYIPSRDIAGLAPEVRGFEPHLALDGGGDGLRLVERLIAECVPGDWLAPGGALYLELGIGQAESVMARLRAAGWADVEQREDLAGIPRVVRGRYCP